MHNDPRIPEKNQRVKMVNQLLLDLSVEIPTLPETIKARDLTIKPCLVSDIKEFVEKHHYSGSINGVNISHCFEATYEKQLVGAAIFGEMATTAWRRFGGTEESVLELRRLVFLDCAGKNSESRMVGYCLRWIKKHAKHVKTVVSYADPHYGHTGTIYKASNFEFVGMSGKDTGYYDKETGKTYHSRALRVKYNGEFKPFVKKLREKKEDGLLVSVDLPGKYCFVYKTNTQDNTPVFFNENRMIKETKTLDFSIKI